MATPCLSRLSKVLVWAKAGSASPQVRSSSDNFFIPPVSRRRVGNLTTMASCQISSSGNGWGEPAACRFLLRGLMFAKNAAQFVLMMKLGAANHAHQTQIHGGGGEHPQRRREKINPQRIPKLRERGAAKRARRVHAHAGNGRFKRDERGHARARKQTGEAGE